jgi:hypothetical protein
MSWPLLVLLQRLVGVAVIQRLHEVRVLRLAVGTRDGVRVVAEEVEALVRMEQQLEAVVALEREWRGENILNLTAF